MAMSGRKALNAIFAAAVIASAGASQAQETTTAPGIDPAVVARGALVELDQLRVIGAKPERVMATMMRDIAAMEAARKAFPNEGVTTTTPAAAKGKPATKPA